MPIDDFTNWTPDICKKKIHEYQRTKDEKIFSLLLAKYDKFIVKLAWSFQKQLHDVPLEDLYHSSIIGFGIAVNKFKTTAQSKMIMAVIKAYVKREIEARYITKRHEEPTGFFSAAAEETSDNENSLEAYFILNSGYLSERDKTILSLRFEEGLSFQEIGDKLNVCRQCVSTRLDKIIKKIRDKTKEEG